MSNGVERNVLVPLSDGETLAVDVYLPAEQPSPAIVSYYPYHKDDVIGGFFEYANRYFAEHGYAGRSGRLPGLGGSSGLPGEAMNAPGGRRRSRTRGVDRSPAWCDGSVGMWGLVLRRHNLLQDRRGAATSPEGDRARDRCLRHLPDWVYPGGCLNCLGLMGWGSYMVAMQMVPRCSRTRTVTGWRCGGTGSTMPVPTSSTGTIIRNRTPSGTPRPPLWRTSRCLTFLIGGWRDISPKAWCPLTAALSGPRKASHGPWLHCAPDQSPFEPVDYLRDHPLVGPLLRDNQRGRGRAAVHPLRQTVRGARVTGRMKKPGPPPLPGTPPCFSAGTDCTGRLADRSGSRTYRPTRPSVPTRVLWDPMALGLGNPQNQAPRTSLPRLYLRADRGCDGDHRLPRGGSST